MIEFVMIVGGVIGYLIGGLVVLFFSFRMWGPLTEGNGWVAKDRREMQQLGYAFLFLFWPLVMWYPLAVGTTRAAYRAALKPPKQKVKTDGYDPAYTKQLEHDLAELKRITDEHRNQEK